MRLFTLLLILFILYALIGSAQSITAPTGATGGRTCGTDAYTEVQQAQDPGFKQRQQQAQQAVEQALQQKPRGQYARKAAITIPVVFHVVYNNGIENISEEQILSQLAVLNADFRRKNADAANTPAYFLPYAADAEIEFCLAVVDPDGNPTTGITRTRTDRTQFSYISDNVKFSSTGGTDAWDRNQYLNIWICNLDGQILGYSSTPETEARRDGVVLHYRAVGAYPANPFSSKYNLGRTGTHEVGHWLGLKHIWGNGTTCTDSDDIDDTPNQEGETQGCPDGISTSCDNGPYGNMWQNYMDYSYDNCMNLYTKGQAAYMQAVLSTTRSTILNAITCSGSLRSDFRVSDERDTLAIAGQTVTFKDASVGLKPLSWLWHFEGGTPATSAEQNPTVTYARPGKYRVSLTITNGNLSSTEEKESFVHVTVNDLAVYPNPASEYITIEQPARVQVRQVELVNRLGQPVLNTEVSDRIVRLDVLHLPAGLYFLRVTSSNGVEIKKVTLVR
ncbi:M43 family zinc metalloprotease [Pontibacter ruber]|uniref:M43 family zinc metalloprotease n=1 Tax=Pontibacter ruber TaxID=1343895 RepID=A0ABW5CY71_9BACT|nr:M43 family zinc metalloprotease [Pontibacter ruber]